MSSVTIGRRGKHLALVNNDTHQGIGMLWDEALKFGRVMSYKSRGVIPAEIERFKAVEIMLKDEQIIIQKIGGEILFILPIEIARQVGSAIVAKAHLLESEDVNINEQIAFDQAFLLRAGIKLGLSSDPSTQDSAGKEAAWNTNLRRWLPSSKNLIQQALSTPRIRKEI